MKQPAAPLHPLFSAYGIELEYALVARDSLDVLPIADRYLTPAGAARAQTPMLAWSNELVLHVLEVKNPRPQALEVLPTAFQDEVRTMNRRLGEAGAQLMPTAMHPWMRPATETRLWPHAQAEIYAAYDRIFDCRRHGWANLQSMHLNLPFASAGEFARLHASLRLILPILPALAASSPLADGTPTGFVDTRMEAYRRNSSAIPAITGAVVPEPVASPEEYRTRILAPMYAAIAPLDPSRILQHEWLNARGAIARFERYAIEVRVLDMQECPQADLAIAAAVVGLTRMLYPRAAEAEAGFDTATLARLLAACVRAADQAVIDDAGYLALFDFPGPRARAGELWQHLIAALPAAALGDGERHALDLILRHGPLARRILRALKGDASRPRLFSVYRELCACLEQGRQFLG